MADNQRKPHQQKQAFGQRVLEQAVQVRSLHDSTRASNRYPCPRMVLISLPALGESPSF